MATYQVPAPPNFNFRQPEEWSKWLRRFERFRQASDLDKKNDEKQVNALIYAMGDEADDILNRFICQKVTRRSTRLLKRNLTSIS